MEKDFNQTYKEFIDVAVQQTSSIYGLGTNSKQLENFKWFFKDFIETAMLDGRFNGGMNGEKFTAFTSASICPTNNLAYALMASGISPDGLLPDNSRCYLSTSLTPTNKVIETARANKQSAGFVETTINNIYNWYSSSEDAKQADPNASELVEIFVRANNVKNAGGQLSPHTEQQLNELWENRKNNYIKNGLGNNNLSYEICSSCFDGDLSKANIDLASMNALKKMAGVDLWIQQNSRNGVNIQFKNSTEIMELTNCITASKQYTQLDLSKYIDTFIQETGMEIEGFGVKSR